MRRVRLALVSFVFAASFGCGTHARGPTDPVVSPPPTASASAPDAPLPDGVHAIFDGGHRGRVDLSALSLDGNVLATVGSDFSLRMWDLASGFSDPSFRLDFTPQNLAIDAAGAAVVVQLDTFVAFYDRKTRQVVTERSNDADCLNSQCLVPSPDRTLVALATPHGFQVREFHGGKVLCDKRAFGPGVRLDWSDDGKWLLVSTSDHTTRVTDPRTGKDRAAFTGMVAVSQAALSPDDATLFVRGGSSLKAWDVLARSALFEIDDIDGGGPFFVAPDGQTIVDTETNPKPPPGRTDLVLRSAKTGAIKRRIALPGASFSLRSLGSKKAYLWVVIRDVGDKAVVVDFDAGTAEIVLDGAPGELHAGRLPMVHEAPRGVRVVDLASQATLIDVTGDVGDLDPAIVAWSPTGESFAVLTAEGELRVHDAKTAAITLRVPASAPGAKPQAVRYASNGRMLVERGGEISVVDRAGKTLWTAATPPQGYDVPNEGDVYVVLEATGATIRSLADNAAVRTIKVDHAGFGGSIAPDGKHLAITVVGPTWVLYDVATGAIVGDPIPLPRGDHFHLLAGDRWVMTPTAPGLSPRIQNPNGDPWSVDALVTARPIAYDAGLTLAAQTNDGISLFHEGTRTVVAWPRADHVTSLALSPDGTRAVIATTNALRLLRFGDAEPLEIDVGRADPMKPNASRMVVRQLDGAFDAAPEDFDLVRAESGPKDAPVVERRGPRFDALLRPGLYAKWASNAPMPKVAAPIVMAAPSASP